MGGGLKGGGGAGCFGAIGCARGFSRALVLVCEKRGCFGGGEGFVRFRLHSLHPSDFRYSVAVAIHAK